MSSQVMRVRPSEPDAFSIHSNASSNDSESSADSATAIQIRRFPFSRIKHKGPDDNEAEEPADKDAVVVLESLNEVKNIKYWASKMAKMFKQMRQSPEKKRKNSWDSVSWGFEEEDFKVMQGLSNAPPKVARVKSKGKGSPPSPSTSNPPMGLEGEFDDLDGQQVRIKPEAIETLCQVTKFTRRELQLMYRGFKQDCPSGVVKEDTFKIIYAQFFPRGSDTSQYAHFVFNTFDPEHTGGITFTDFVIGLSVLARGSVQDKLRWTFSLYDLDGDGVITKNELTRIVSAVFDLMGRSAESRNTAVEERATKEHVDNVFRRLDINHDGMITIEEFLDICLKDKNITKSLEYFNTVL